MSVFGKAVCGLLLAGVLAPSVFANGREPGSMLIYPIHRSGGATGDVPNNFWFTIICVTNINLEPITPLSFGGSTDVHFQYVNTVYNQLNPFQPLACTIFNRVEFLTPADHLSVLTSCHNATAGKQEGYLVVTAATPIAGPIVEWSFNYLIGSETVINGSGAMYSMNAIPFRSPRPEKLLTDDDFDGCLEFDDREYEAAPDFLYMDCFLAVSKSRLTLLNLTGNCDSLVTVHFDAWNDNEFPLSQDLVFKVWFDQPLNLVSASFDDAFLRINTPNDPKELDINCDNNDDFETGWAIIDGVVVKTPGGGSEADPILLGALTAGPISTVDGGRLLWESERKQQNGCVFQH